MNGKQHLVIGAITGGVGAYVIAQGGHALLAPGGPAIIAAGIGAVLGGLGGLTPDIDQPNATISRKLPQKLVTLGLALLSPLLLAGLLTSVGKKGDFTDIILTIKPMLQSDLTLAGAMIIGGALALLVLARMINALWGHRGATHSLFFAGLATALWLIPYLVFAIPWWYGAIFGLGYLSHLLADATTEKKLPALWWPFTRAFGRK